MVGSEQVARKAKEDMNKHFYCNKIEEFLGNKIEIDYDLKTQNSPNQSCCRVRKMNSC
jgi:hypothetical protein